MPSVANSLEVRVKWRFATIFWGQRTKKATRDDIPGGFSMEACAEQWIRLYCVCSKPVRITSFSGCFLIDTQVSSRNPAKKAGGAQPP
jgi:hypothetical protein